VRLQQKPTSPANASQPPPQKKKNKRKQQIKSIQKERTTTRLIAGNVGSDLASGFGTEVEGTGLAT